MPVPKLPLKLTGLLYPYHLLWWRRTLRTRSVVTDWNWRHNALFVHIPKTAGTTVLASLGAPAVFDTHAPAKAYRQAYPDLYRRAYTFTIVRNPWDRFASAFHFMKSGTDWDMQRAWARAHIGDRDFAAFTRSLRRPLHRAAVMAERFFWPQTFWLGGVGDAGGVDAIFRYEQIDEALAVLRDRFGLDAPTATPRLRRVERPHFTTLYDEETRDIVARLYRRDIAALGYDFAS